jgi:hypothetical protein
MGDLLFLVVRTINNLCVFWMQPAPAQAETTFLHDLYCMTFTAGAPTADPCKAANPKLELTI